MARKQKSIYKPKIGKIRFGDMRQLHPFDPYFGFRRGGPVDRYYIENFLKKNRKHIQGKVLEVKENTYTLQYGGRRVIKSDILDIDAKNHRATVIADLSKAKNVPSNTYDCFILTQTLQLIYDLKSVIKHVHRILKPGGALLLTVPGITRIPYKEDSSFWCWSFSEASVFKLLKEEFSTKNIKIEIHGNVLVASAFLYGVGVGELTKKEYDYKDPDYQVIIAAKAVK